uniref:F-box domain-containing protein n=1 Tax=Mycena chlorophos TaxID=658473 RepID=A0ABQ0LGI7_MYCCL|nr:predicted protein [Mycena chlorophos]
MDSETRFAGDIPLTPRIQDLLASNLPPLESDIPSIRQLETTLQSRIARIDEDIAALTARLGPLLTARAALLQEHGTVSGVLSPLRRVPPELLSEIFKRATTAKSSSDDSIDSGTLCNAPWSLMHVSSWWREVARTTPALWTNIRVSFDEAGSSYPQHLVEAHADYAQELIVDFYGCSTFDVQPQINAFSALAKNCVKWTTLKIDLIPEIYAALNELRGQVPLLRKVLITWDVLPTDDSELSAMVFTEDAVSLVDLAIIDAVRYRQICAPFSNLTRYDLRLPWAMHRNLLKQSPCLVEARLITSAADADALGWPGPEREISLISLRRLYVSHGEFLDKIHAPKLAEITYEHFSDADLSSLSHLESLVTFSSCSLTRICITGDPSSEAAPQALQKFPNVSELYIIWSFDEDEDDDDPPEGRVSQLLQLMISDDNGSNCIAPKLAVLSLGWEGFSYLDEDPSDYHLLAQMVASRRRRPDCALRRVEMLRREGEWKLPPSSLTSLDWLADQVDFVFLTGDAAQDVMNSYEYLS